MKWDPEWVVLSMLAGGVLAAGITLPVLVVALAARWIPLGCQCCPMP